MTTTMKVWYELDDELPSKMELADDADVDDLAKAVIKFHNIDCTAQKLQLFSR